MTKLLRKTLVVLLTMTLLAACLFVPNMVNAESEAEIVIWNGETVAPTDSDGDGVYEINTAEELAWAVNNSGGKSYILTKDIYLNDLDRVDWTNGTPDEDYTPNEWFETTTFTGNFDGQGHIVYGLWYPVGNNADVDYNRAVGLFPKLGTNTTVKNLGVKSSYLETKGFAGPIAGFFTDLREANVLIDNCFSDNTVTVKTHQPKKDNYQFGAGGVLGGFYNSGKITVSNCWSNANTSSLALNGNEDGRNNKIVGDIWLASSTWQTTYGDLVMKNCYSVGAKPCPGGDKASFTTFENVYSTEAPTTYGKWTQVSEANMKGSAALENMSGLGDAFSATLGLPVLKIFNKGVAGGTWNGSKDDQILGEGTTESPYLVYTAEQLAYAVNSTANKVFQLQNDIVLNDITVKIEDGVGVIYDANDNKIEDYSTLNTWKSGAFPGTIDGNGHVVRGIYFEGQVANPNSETDWQNCFAFIKTATNTTVVTNLGIEDSYVRYEGGTAAGFVGYIHALSPVVRNSYLGDSVYLEGYNAAGILGAGDGSKLGNKAIANCYVLATLKATGATGPSCGALYSDVWSMKSGVFTVENFYSTSKLTNSGTCGYARASYGSVSKIAGYIGSIADGNNMNIGDAFNYVEGDFPVLKVFDDRDMAWGGLGGAAFEGGDGSESNPYLISTPAQLAYMVYSGGGSKYYKLINDIVITDLDDVNWATGELKEGLGYTPVNWFGGKGGAGDTYGNLNSSTNYARFSGNFNGNGYVISGIYYEPYYDGRDIEKDGEWSTCVGLIPSITGTTISDVMITDSYIFGGRFTGGVVGHSTNSTINNVVVANSVTVKTIPTGKVNGESKEFESYSAGGIVGYAHGTFNMDNCGSSANVVCASHRNGLIGTRWNTKITISDSYSVGVRPLAKDGSTNGSDAASNVYTDATTTGAPEGVIVIATDQITGKNALDNMPGLDTEYWYGVTEQGPLPYAYGERICDISCDGKFDKASETVALRVGLITGEDLLFADINCDTVIDICDLVAFTK